LAIGFGSFLIALLYFTQDLLLAQAKLEENNSAANIILLDVQSDQQKPVSALLREQDLPILENTPIVTMRLHRIKDSLVSDIRADSASTINSWILTHEFRVTYRDSLIPSEKVKEGEWHNEYSGSGPIPISLSVNVAQDAQVGIGDRLIFNVQGVLMETVLASIRDVDWGRVQLNFSVVFPSGVLEKAPQFHVFSTRVEDAKSSAQIQQLLVAQFPNITVLDIRQLIDVATGIFDKISWVIRFMAFLSILTGFIILLGAVRNSKFQRMRENVLLRTLGAKSFQIRRIVLLEYVLLGSIGSLAGVFLALFATELLAGNLFNMPFNPSWIPFGLLVPFITITVAILGLVNSRSIINSPPLEVLRREGV
jgi:putative ABC transport system permease protein